MAITGSDRTNGLPPGLLSAIGIVESGRLDPQTRVVSPWPWTIDANGTGELFATKAEAVAEVQRLQAAGTTSIDVGCMQINLSYHPRAFASLEEAFDPTANVQYATRFLLQLHARLADWLPTIAAYHSATPGIGQPYADRVEAVWRPDSAPDAGRKAMAVQAAQTVDPYQVLTPEFKAQLLSAAAFQRRRNAELGIVPIAVSTGAPTPQGRSNRRARARAPQLVASLERVR